MDNLRDDSEKNAKVSDSAYSNSCSNNSQSRKSHSSKSTHSGSNSSGSSGYGGKQSTSGSSKALNQLPERRTKDKEGKKKKQGQTELVKIQADVEFRLPEPPSIAEAKQSPTNVARALPKKVKLQKGAPRSTAPTHGNRDQSFVACNTPQKPIKTVSIKPSVTPTRDSSHEEGFSCVVSMLNGVVLYVASALHASLRFPMDMWIGRSFIDFVHPSDHNTFASQITSGLAVPKKKKGNFVSTMFCRIRRHRGLESGFSVKDQPVNFKPFMLKLLFRDVCEEDGDTVYLVIQATPLYSAFKIRDEVIVKAVPFMMRHVANGSLEYIDNEAVPFLGYMPQDILGKDVLKLYHPEDLTYMRHLYETIIKQGQVPRSKPYRLLTQNGHYLILETEWSSFINPWSRKLEFVIGKHHIIKGPENPDVFQLPAPTKNDTEEPDKDIESIKESIVMILNQVPTRPAEVAKLQMNKRCQDVVSFMESLIADRPKLEEELRLEIQDNDNSFFERDSVMLGGISPHHEYTDSKSSSATPLSYNQLNFNINLKRYFDSHHETFDEDMLKLTDPNIMTLKLPQHQQETCMSPVAQLSGDSVEMNSSESLNLKVAEEESLALLREYQSATLTESLLTKHNSEMEKKFVKKHRETRLVKKEVREQMSNENKQKKKDHLVRCNASFIAAPENSSDAESLEESATQQPHGLKRASMPSETEPVANKQQCTLTREMRPQPTADSMAATPVASADPVATTASTWTPNFNNGINPFMSPQMLIVSPIAAVPGFVPMYYVPAASPAVPCTSEINASQRTNSNENLSQSQNLGPAGMQYMMYGQPVFGSPFMVPAVNHQVPLTMHPNIMQRQYTNYQNCFYLPTGNYEEACKILKPLKPPSKEEVAAWRGRWTATSASTSAATSAVSTTSATSPATTTTTTTTAATATAAATTTTTTATAAATTTTTTTTTSTTSATSTIASITAGNAASPSSKSSQGCNLSSVTSSATNALNRSTEAVPESSSSRGSKMKTEETLDRTDGGSSYSSFYSSFFKTESGSAEESGDARKTRNNTDSGASNNGSKDFPGRQKRKMEPPWMEQVCVTSDLIYKYHVLTKSLDEVLISDKKKLARLEQSSLVNEQLGQLYMDLELEGVAARLTLEEGVTSSGSSSDDSHKKMNITVTSPEDTLAKRVKRKRKYSKLGMIYEEDAPLPPPDDEREPAPEPAPPMSVD